MFRIRLSSVFVLLLSAIGSVFFGLHVAPVYGASCPELEPGDRFTVPAVSTAVYVLNYKKERMYFPSSDVYYTWFTDFTGVVHLDASCVSAYPAATHPAGVTYRPGSRLIKTQNAAAVYAVGEGSTRMQITNEEAAMQLYGQDWASRVRDVPEVYWGNYTEGTMISSGEIQTGMIISRISTNELYLVQGTLLVPLTGSDLSLLRSDSIPYSEYVLSSYTIDTMHERSQSDVTRLPWAFPPVDPVLPVRTVSEDTDHIQGTIDAPVTLITYSDFQCPFCKDQAETVATLLNTYPDDIRFVYRHFPLRSIHPEAVSAAEAAECAGEQDAFWEFHDLLFFNQLDLNAALYSEIADSLALDTDMFMACLADTRYDAVIEADEFDGQLGEVRGTPTSFLITQDGRYTQIVGAQPLSVFQSAIDELLAT